VDFVGFLSAFGLSAALTPAVKRLAARFGWMAYPVKDRWHKRPTALMGGIAIYAGMAIPLVFAAAFSTLIPHFTQNPLALPVPDLDAAIWTGIGLMFCLGMIDDFLRIKPHTKLVGQILVASLMTFWGFRLHWFDSLTLDTVVTIVWIVGITNALNLIDNMDGLCAGVALIAAGYFGWLFAAEGMDGSPSALILSGSLLGFLIYNFNPASIFMGDSGSLPIGFTLAMLGLNAAGIQSKSPVAAYAVPVMVLLVPILDTTLVTNIRILSGRKASTGGKDHTSHRLVLMGFSERGAVLFLYGVGLISGIAGVFVHQSDTLTSPAAIIPLLIAVLLMGVYMAQLRVYPEKEFSLLRDHAYTPILLELTYKRQLMLVILDFGLIAFSYYLSYRLRFSGDDFIFYFKVFLHSLPTIIACKFVAFFAMGIYRGFWRYLSTDDVFVYIKSTTIATLLSVAVVTFIYRFQDFSKGLFLIDWLVTTGLLLGTRGSFRIFVDAMSRKTMRGEKVLIYGAGRGGEILLRELIHNQQREMVPVGFVDDDVLKMGKKIQGYPILGTFQDAGRLLTSHPFGGILVSFNGHSLEGIGRVRDFCRENDLFLKQFAIHLEHVDLES